MYIKTRKYEHIWDDKGSSAHQDVSFWKALNYQTDYFSLGDSTDNLNSDHGHHMPKSDAILVKANKDGILITPTLEKVWDDKGSGAHKDVSIYRMIAPQGFTCLGSVVIASHEETPDPSKYCCVANEYVVPGKLAGAWWDKGSSAHNDVSVYSIERTPTYSYGLIGNSFLTFDTFNPDTKNKGFLLKSMADKVVDVAEMPIPERPILMHESVAINYWWLGMYFGFTRPASNSGHKIASQNPAPYSKIQTPLGFILRENPAVKTDEDIFKLPEYCKKVWGAPGNILKGDEYKFGGYLAVFQPWCPPGYVPLGYIATVNPEDAYEQVDCNNADEKVYCVQEKYTVKGSERDWKKVYAGRGWHLNQDKVTFYEAIPENNTNFISVRGFGLAHGENQAMDEPPRFLRADMVSLVHEKPIAKIEVISIDYEYNNKDIRNTKPTMFSRTPFKNCNYGKQDGAVKVSLSETTSESFTWDVSVMVGVSVTATTGPDIAQFSKTASLEITTSFGGTTVEEETTTTDTELKVSLDPR